MIPKNNKVLFLLGGLLAVIFLFILIRIFTANQGTSTTTPSPVPTSTETPTLNPSQSTKPVYNLDSSQKDFERITNKKELIQTDQDLRDKLISSLNNQSGTLVKNSSFIVEYNKSPNSFMVEILSNDADSAKKQAIQWFTDQGLSQNGVCNLPVVLFLNSDVNSYYKQQGLEFNPVPDGC